MMSRGANLAEAPVFIGGLSYSGKTQLRQALECHPNLSMVRRSTLWKRYHGRFGDLKERSNWVRACDQIAADGLAGESSIDWSAVLSGYESEGSSYARLFGVIQRQWASAKGRPRWGEQYGNIVYFAAEIFTAYPGATMIHMIRHPQSRVLRILNKRSHRPGWIGWEIGGGVESLRLSQANSEVYPGRYVTMSYESLRIDPLGTVTWVCELINEDPEPITASERFGQISFDSERATASDPRTERVEKLAERAVRDWPSRPESSGAAKNRFNPAYVAAFPVDSAALWVRLHTQFLARAR